MARPLKFWEQICSNMGVTMGFQLEGKLDAAMIKGAYEYIQKMYPFLRMVLKQANNALAFVEHPSVCRFSFLFSPWLPLMPTMELRQCCCRLIVHCIHRALPSLLVLTTAVPRCRPYKSSHFSAVQPCELKVVTGKLPSFSTAMVDVANTNRDHSKSVMYMDLFRCAEPQRMM
jgi:hypothetical protein